MKNILALSILTVVTIGCQKSAELSEGNKTEIRSEVQELLKENFRLIKAEGYTAELKSLYNSPDFFWVPPRKSMPISYDSVAAILRQFTPGYKSVENTWETLLIQPINSEVASYTGRFHSIYIDTTGHTSEFNMMEIGVVAKKNGKWKLVSGQTSVAAE